MTLTTKLGTGFLATSSIAGLGYAGSTYFKDNKKEVINTQEKTAISKLIKDQFEYMLLDTSDNNDSSYWETNWNNYNNENTASEAGQDVFQLTSWTKGNSKNLTAELKKKCGTLSNTEVLDKNDVLYSKVTKYCGRRVTVADAIGKLELEILDTTSSSDKHSTIWDKRVNEKDTLRDELTALKISGDTSDKSTIKNGCNTAKAKSKDDDDYQTTLNAYKKVCTKQDGDPN